MGVRTSYCPKASLLSSPLDQEFRGYGARFGHKGEELGTYVSPPKGSRLEKFIREFYGGLDFMGIM
jgi:hypothetical protein